MIFDNLHFFQACRILLTFGVDASIVSLQVSEVDLLFGLYFGRALALFHSRAVCQHWEHLKVMNLNWDFVTLRVSQQPSFPLSLLERSWQRSPQLAALILVSFSHFYPFWGNVFIKTFHTSRVPASGSKQGGWSGVGEENCQPPPSHCQLQGPRWWETMASYILFI